MRPVPLVAAGALLALSACHASVAVGDDATEQGDNVHIAMNGGDSKNHVTLDVPGLSAKISLPGLNLSEHLDLDGIQLAPNTNVKTVDVQGNDKGNDKADEDHVRVEFTNPGAPAGLIDYYRKAATDAGYSGVATTATGVSAEKGGKQFALSISPEGSGSRGAITMRGSE